MTDLRQFAVQHDEAGETTGQQLLLAGFGPAAFAHAGPGQVHDSIGKEHGG